MTGNTVTEKVHIIPLGYEIDRAIISFKNNPVNRVYLLTMKQLEKYRTPEEISMTERERHYESTVSRELIHRGISVIIQQIDMFNVLEVMTTIAGIIVSEREKNADIRVNMSACGRLTSFATTMAAMAHHVPLYYVRVDRYADNPADISSHGLSICEKERIWELEQIPLTLPEGTRMNVLIMLAGADDGLYTWEILDNLIESGENGFSEPFRKKSRQDKRTFQRRYHTKLNKSILTPLITAGYIRQWKIGRFHKVAITASGHYIAAVSGRTWNCENGLVSP